MGSINPELITIIVAIIVVSVFEGARYYFKKNKISNEVVSKDVLEISQVVNVFATLLKSFVPNDVALFSNILNVFEQGLKLFKDASNPQINDADTTKEAVSQILNSNNIVVNDDIKNAINAGIDLAISKIKENDDSNVNQVTEQSIETPTVKPTQSQEVVKEEVTPVENAPTETKVETPVVSTEPVQPAAEVKAEVPTQETPQTPAQ